MPDTTPREITFLIPGQRLAARGGELAEAPASSGLPGHRKAFVQLATRRDGGALVRTSATVGEDVVVLHVEGGPELVLHPLTARDLLLAQADGQPLQRGAPGEPAEEPGEVRVPAELQWRGLEKAAASRSAGFLGRVVLRAVEIVTGLFDDAGVAERAARDIAQRIDAGVAPGVYRLAPERLGTLGREQALPCIDVPAPGRPVLVLLHGTFVDTACTFGQLWVQHPARVRELFDHYGGQVYALDHATLGDSPIDNALQLVQALPRGVPVQLHLVSHSRGGLVAEVLARVAATREVTAQELGVFQGERHARLRAQLQALAAALAEREVTVERVVRVACPARGTLLASRRLDAYLSVLRWSLQLAGVPVAPALVNFLAAVARERFDPETLPGLYAMTPENPLVQWLNDAQAPVPGELRVVAGDVEGDSVLGWLKTLLADAFYWTDNDIVVQTSSMYGGAPRSAGASYLLDRGAHATHFGYFHNKRTADAVVDGLVRDAPAGFAPIGPLSWEGRSADGHRGAVRGDPVPRPERPAVFVLPGILGSHIEVDGRRVWLGWRVLGGLRRLEYAPGQWNVRDGGPLGDFYDDLIDDLEQSHEVIPFGFDWRRPLEEEARRLGQRVQQALDARAASGMPVRFVAHSMGGLLVRTMMLECPEVWKRVCLHEGGRLLMLGTPNGGSWAPMQVLSGDDTFGNFLVGVGAPFRGQQARQLMAQFPGFLQLQAGLTDRQLALSSEETWQKLARDDLERVRQASWWHRNPRPTEAGDTQLAAYEWGVPSKSVLEQAVALRQRLDRQRDEDLPRWADRMLLVVGRASFTPDGYEWADEGFVYLDAENGGDGRVTLASALLPQVRTWTLDAEHGKLPSRRSAFDAFRELLETGDTRGLKVLAAGARRGSEPGGAPAPVAHVRSRPSRGRLAGERPADSVEAVFDRAPERRAGAEAGPRAPALRVTVLNANLAFVRQPLLVGHYTASRLTGAELAVNAMVGGVMEDALSVGRYPQTAGAAQVFLNHAAPRHEALLPRPEGVVVVGLGAEGSLTEATLAETVCQGVLAWTERLAEAAHGPAGIELAAVLVGSGGIGIEPGNSARAIATGVRAANARIARLNQRLKRAAWPHVAHLWLVELYLERAAEAWRGLQVQALARPGELDLAPTIETGTASLRRQVDSAYRGAAYDFISITSLRDPREEAVGAASSGAELLAHADIQFRLDTRRARTELRAVRAQPRLLHQMLCNASNDHRCGPQAGQIGRTLFQLLVPLEIEPFLAGRSQMLLEVDQGTAIVPWELLDTASEKGREHDHVPWSIRSRLIRKLATSSYRDAVRDTGREDDVLVVGEPLCPPRYGRLDGALREARAIAALMKGPRGVGADRVVGLLGQADATAIINALMSRPYRVVHVAGHGEPGRDGGVVLSGDTVLGPREIAQMRAVPELVFVNCCHLAVRPEQQFAWAPDPFSRSDFAASTADALIAIGVRCVVAAGWAVDDAPAELFAQTFYQALLGGRSFIEAVGEAREATWRKFPQSNTWAAYQCYGDPEWRLRRLDDDGPGRPVAGLDLQAEYGAIASAVGLKIALEKIAMDARYEPGDQLVLQEHVRYLVARFGTVWGHVGSVAEALGAACIGTGLTEEGIAWYERALAANDASASLLVAEQLANQRVRQAWRQVDALESGAGTPAAGREAVRQAIEQQRRVIAAATHTLQSLQQLQPTIERHALIGSAFKRLTMLERQASVIEQAWLDADAGDEAACADLRDRVTRLRQAEGEALTAMAHAYDAGVQLARALQHPQLYYPAINCMAAELIRPQDPQGGQQAGFSDEAVAAVRKSLDQQLTDKADFWLAVSRIELDIYVALQQRTLEQALPKIAALFDDLHGRVPSPGLWGTPRDQQEFVLERWLARSNPSAGERAAAGSLLQLLLRYAPKKARAVAAPQRGSA
ncbi:CHAT domain-containing protein [Pseudorhodoferax sp.]|uniref:CHAT domain-containing protein n=1 Tax=Pseudorhodoferax sp. TaxID=1993553 RepID=UPI0039E72B89